MIGKIIMANSFKACINYCLDDKLTRSQEVVFKYRAEILHFNQCFGNKKELIEQFNEVRKLNPNLSKPVLHITLSLAPSEKLSKGTWSEIVEDCAKYFRFEKNQFIAVSHIDTGHQHLHIVANRIGFDGKTVTDSNSYKKMAAYCRQMEQKFELQQVLSPKRFLREDMRQLPRFDSRKEAMKDRVRECLAAAKNYSEFETFLRTKNYQVIKGRGIAFVDSKGVYAKGSELGYSLAEIEKILQLPVYQKQAVLVRAKQEQPHPTTGLHSEQRQVNYLSKEPSHDLKLEPNKILANLLMPVHTESKVPLEFTKRKKKKRSQHL